jgi:hypothetical protein
MARISVNVAEIVAEARRYGIELQPEGGVLHVSAKRKPPESVLKELRAHKPEVLTFLRFGSLTSGGKMCRRCLTINRCRALAVGFVCDRCRRDDDEQAIPASLVAAKIMPDDPIADNLLTYALERIQAVADQQHEDVVRMEARFAAGSYAHGNAPLGPANGRSTRTREKTREYGAGTRIANNEAEKSS